MDSDLNTILKGIQLLLGAQLLIVAMLHLLAKPDRRRVLLSFLCLIHGLWFFKHAFAGYWPSHFLLFLLIGPGKPIFVGAIILFYLQTFSQNLNSKSVFRHLIIPVTYYLILIVVRFFLARNLSNDSANWVSIAFSVSTLAIFWFYFFLSRKEMKDKVRGSLIPEAYQRLRLLFYSLYFFLLQIPVWDIFDKLNKTSISLGDFQWILNIYNQLFIYAGYYASYSYIHFLGYFIFLYAISELPYLKKYLLPRETMIKKTVLEEKDMLDHRIKELFEERKIFRNPDLTLDSCASLLQVSTKVLVQYLKITHQCVFKDFINKRRIEEFKLLMRDDSYRKYDLVGIAHECGFRSKSTFNRVFKEKERMTPGEYKRRSGLG